MYSPTLTGVPWCNLTKYLADFYLFVFPSYSTVSVEVISSILMRSLFSSEMYTKLARIKNIKNLSIGTDRPMQTVQTQIRRRREQGNETNLGEQES